MRRSGNKFEVHTGAPLWQFMAPEDNYGTKPPRGEPGLEAVAMADPATHCNNLPVHTTFVSYCSGAAFRIQGIRVHLYVSFTTPKLYYTIANIH